MTNSAGGDGDLMLAATNLLRPGPTRIGSLGRVTLPRTVRLRSVLSWLIGGTLGLIPGATASSVLGGLGPLAAGLFIGAGAGHLVVNAEPLPGEHLLSWLFLASGSHRHRVNLNGIKTRIVLRPIDEGPPPGPSPVEVARAGDMVAYALAVTGQLQRGAQVFIGICPLETVAVGEVRIVGGMVAVRPEVPAALKRRPAGRRGGGPPLRSPRLATPPTAGPRRAVRRGPRAWSGPADRPAATRRRSGVARGAG